MPEPDIADCAHVPHPRDPVDAMPVDGSMPYLTALRVVHDVVDTLCTVVPAPYAGAHFDFSDRPSALLGAACEVVDICYE